MEIIARIILKVVSNYRLIVIIILAVEGNWLVTFENLSTQYLLNVWITAVIWISAIIGIPAVIIGLLFFLYKKD